MTANVLKQITALCFLILALVPSGCTEDDPSPTPADPREVFLGDWIVNETGSKLTYEVTIALDPNSSTNIWIFNFANSGSGGNPAVASVSGNSVTLNSNQTIGDGWVVNGGGILSGSSTINWTYTLFDGATQYDLVAVYTRKS